MTTRCAQNFSPRQHGFTLVELVAVVVIVGIVAAIAAPRFVDTVVFNERGYADEIAASLRYAQRVAIASECNVRFTVNAAAYSAAQPTGQCNPATGWGTPVQSPDRTLLTNATPAGVAVNAVVFDFNGAGALVNPAGPVNVGAFVVSVNAATGAVTVQ
jgi:MSHA pilin protein MshC